MEKDALLLLVCHSMCVWSAHIESEMVWLKEVAASVQTNKRKYSDANLPDNLAFQLRVGSRALILNLKRNHAIDPNANVYFVSKLNDGKPLLEKAQALKEEELAYYQDKKNGAFMTVKCLIRSSGGCDRVLNGNIQIEDRNYDLHPAKSDITSRDLFDVPDLGTRYVLRDQINVQREISVTHEDTTTDKVKQVFKGLLQRFPNGQEQFPFSNFTFLSRQGSNVHNRGNAKQVYNVETAILLDSTIWDFYFSLMMLTNNALAEPDEVARKIREVYSHIINGANLRYSTIDDPGIEISVTLHNFYIFKTMEDFGHNDSMVEFVHGKDKVDVVKYLYHQALWTLDNAIIGDHVMLFSKYDMYDSSTGEIMYGYSYIGSICHETFKTTLIQSRDYFLTVSTAAHELGHNLGANHDGEGNAIACRADDYFLMTPLDPVFNKTLPYSRNPWVFSNCSVDVFKDVLKNKTCLNNVGTIYNEMEWNKFTYELPGQVYSLDHQCELFNGHGSAFCGTETPDICHFMKCTDPFTQRCLPKYFSAYRGTSCGTNMLFKNNNEPNGYFFQRVRFGNKKPNFNKTEGYAESVFPDIFKCDKNF